MNKMRQEAIRRSQEMHKRSMVNASHYSQGNHEKWENPEKNKTVHNDQPMKMNNPEKFVKKKEPMLSDIVDNLFQGKLDSDKLMILMLMIILIKEGADLKLILALGYILL